MKTKTDRIVAEVPAEVKKRLRIIAAHEGKSLQVVVERLINEEYEELEQRQQAEDTLTAAK